MLDEFSPSFAEAGLKAALQSKRLSAAAQAQAEVLWDRLERGVCVMLLGPASVGKSQLCNALVGQVLDGMNGRVSRVISERAIDAERFAELGEVQTVTCDHNALSQAQIVDMACSDDPDENAHRLGWALDKADIVLWCTERFDEEEARIWAKAPDALKDHSFLVLTKADMSDAFGDLAKRITALQAVVEEEFHSMFPVTTPHVQHLLEAGSPVSDSDRAASGIKALADALQSVVASGQRADLDGALLFLERHGLADEAEIAPSFATPPAPSLAAPHTSEAQNMPFKKARDAIMKRALDLAEMSFDDCESDLSGVLDLCSAISEEVADILRAEEGDLPEVQPWCRAFEEASDKIMLMSMENDARSAADAVTILLQMRRDLEYHSVH